MQPGLSLLCLLPALALLAPARSPTHQASAAAEPLKVVATIPDLGELARSIGGERVAVTTLTRGTENLHAVTARPSHLVALNRAELFVQVGLSLESAFVPGLLEGARNRRIQPGSPGFVNASEGFEPLGVPDSLSRKGGDVHPRGNPHMNLDPGAGELMASNIHAGLVRVDPGSKALYDRNLESWLARLAEARKRWEEQASAFKGQKIAVYHQEYEYLAKRYELRIVAAVELRPGIPPTPNHMARVIETLKQEGVRVLLVAPWADNSDARRVAEAAVLELVVLPNQAGSAGMADWIAMMDVLHKRLAAAFAPGKD